MYGHALCHTLPGRLLLSIGVANCGLKTSWYIAGNSNNDLLCFPPVPPSPHPLAPYKRLKLPTTILTTIEGHSSI